ncbi:hypothetical protein [Burkholderia sp. Ac-20365]|uniref:hypothetical protein n=1 Tax=Burkholderia sp. Ac-20365 TaxID=2703897 RepID=UPI00197C71FA|nr:hypothetical protein [Burkholderia sp. Ac-20365]MBN3761270.1 hypothetical protein [Burkholderia sp. Ac-20365]
MSVALSISLVANTLLCVTAVVLVRRLRLSDRLAAACASREREAADRLGSEIERVTTDFCALGSAVSATLEAIREDVNRNYHHIHDGHVLDVLAFRLRREVEVHPARVGEIVLDEELARRAEALGASVSTRRTMTLGQILEFGLRLHAVSRERAGRLTEVVRQPCGDRDHADWLGKTLAIYELMCGGDKDLAVRRLSAVIETWHFEPSTVAAWHVEGIR